MSIEFKEYGKTPRLFRDMIITEKIDGTNAGIQIVPWAALVNDVSEGWNWEPDYFRKNHRNGANLLAVVGEPRPGGDTYGVFAQSRNRLLTLEQDNAGFARWVNDNAEALVRALGEGTHYGEWYGEGIQKNPLGIAGKRFALFNVGRWGSVDFPSFGLDNVETVPHVYQGRFDTHKVALAVELLTYGSWVKGAKPEAKPEGVVVYHGASRQVFKVLCDSDDLPKTVRDAA